MSLPFTPPPATVIYHVSINGGEETEFLSPAKASKFVADNIFYGNDAHVRFENAIDVQTVRADFEKRINEWLIQLGHRDGFWCEPTPTGVHYRLRE
jgi:hypothetical protein